MYALYVYISKYLVDECVNLHVYIWSHCSLSICVYILYLGFAHWASIPKCTHVAMTCGVCACLGLMHAVEGILLLGGLDGEHPPNIPAGIFKGRSVNGDPPCLASGKERPNWPIGPKMTSFQRANSVSLRVQVSEMFIVTFAWGGLWWFLPELFGRSHSYPSSTIQHHWPCSDPVSTIDQLTIIISCFGPSIAIIYQLPSTITRFTIVPSFPTGRACDGYVLQKYVERPHLLDDQELLKAQRWGR